MLYLEANREPVKKKILKGIVQMPLLCVLISPCLILRFQYRIVFTPLWVACEAVQSYCYRPPPPLFHSPADVKQGRLVVPAVYLLPLRGFTWEATAQINSLNSQCSVGTSSPLLPRLLTLNSAHDSSPLITFFDFHCVDSFHYFFALFLYYFTCFRQCIIFCYNLVKKMYI